MTNKQRWDLYTQALPSPQLYIDAAFYFMIAASLQRRVWLQPIERPLFFNQYVVLCGPPGVGKDAVLNDLRYFLTYLKAFAQKNYEDASDLFASVANKKELTPGVLSLSPIQLARDARMDSGYAPKPTKDAPLRFPMTPDDLSYQRFIRAFIDSMAGGFYKDLEGNPKSMVYCSLCCILAELSSLVKKGNEDICRMLLKLYDCGDYTYETISRQQDKIKNLCFNLIAGTTPKYMKFVADKSLLEEGFNSRVWYIYAKNPRHRDGGYPEFTVNQKLAAMELIQHLDMLSKVKGQCFLSQDAEIFFRDWWRREPFTRKYPNPKLIDYYARKNIHVKKLAAAHHFAEIKHPDDRIITLPSIKFALSFLEHAERDMHLSLDLRASNQLYEPGERLLHRIKDSKDGLSMIEVKEFLLEDLRGKEVEELISDLTKVGKIFWEDKQKRFKIK